MKGHGYTEGMEEHGFNEEMKFYVSTEGQDVHG